MKPKILIFYRTAFDIFGATIAHSKDGGMMKERLLRLERLAAPLEPDEEERLSFREKIIQYTESFLINLPQMPAFVATDDQGIGILDSPISQEPIEIDEALNLLKAQVDRPGENTVTGKNLAYIPISGLYLSALADYMAAITNRFSTVFFAAPGAVRIERMLLRWMADFIGYPQTATGDLTSGGSTANLIGIVTARDAHDLKAKDYSRSTVYLSEQTHHSIEKALRIAGLRECIKRYIPIDDRYRMLAEVLDEAIKKDKESGLNPWLIVLNAGTTNTGAVDPLATIAEIAQSHGIWLHIDGAYGAMFALCEKGKRILEGIERSDSLILDPHKSLFLPLGSGTVLVREGKKQLQAHSYDSNYLQDGDALASPDEISPAELSIEFSRPFRGLRLWLPLKLLGVSPFRAALEEKLLLAQYFHKKMQGVDGFELGPSPDLSIVTFRYLPEQGDINEFNRKLIYAIQQDGRIFLSSTTIDGTFILRLAVLGIRTHMDTIDTAIEILKEKVRAVEKM